MIFRAHGLLDACDIALPIFNTFLCEIEARYGANSYHNSIHAADVMLTCHHFVNITGVIHRLTKLQVLALLLGAIIHDFNHPGTSNAHEVKVCCSHALSLSLVRRPRTCMESEELRAALRQRNRMCHPARSQVSSSLAICYSDQSVLERHHLASAFTLLNRPQCQVLKGLDAADYCEVRRLIIDLVLQTDLSKHF
eukprot:3972534-Prymnesium_polylepis.1